MPWLLFRLKTYQLVLLFYKTILIVSIAITIFLFITKVSFFSVLCFKLVLLGIYSLKFLDDKSKQSFVFYNNFGLSKTLLFRISFALDVAISILIYLIFFY